MAIKQEVKLSMSDVIDMIKSKLGLKSETMLDTVVITDYSPETKSPEDMDGVGEVKDIIASTLVKKSNIVKVLKEGLEGAGSSGRFPKNADRLCADAMNETLEDFSKKEAEMFKEIVTMKNFAGFAILWQKYQTNIQKKL